MSDIFKDTLLEETEDRLEEAGGVCAAAGAAVVALAVMLGLLVLLLGL